LHLDILDRGAQASLNLDFRSTVPSRAVEAESGIARSLMLADLAVDESVKLQQQSLGTDRKLGCGLFVPHKDIREVKSVSDY
jgi:CRISPR-associated endoribonuclease Cas6